MHSPSFEAAAEAVARAMATLLKNGAVELKNSAKSTVYEHSPQDDEGIEEQSKDREDGYCCALIVKWNKLI